MHSSFLVLIDCNCFRVIHFVLLIPFPFEQALLSISFLWVSFVVLKILKSMLSFKKELIATILDAVVFQHKAGTWPYATVFIVPPHQIQTLHSWKTWMGWLRSDFNIAIIDQVVKFWKMNGIDIFTFFNEICERRCRNRYHPDCNETRTIDLT